MRNLNTLNQYRQTAFEEKYAGVSGNDKCGFFVISSPVDGKYLCIVAASDMGWDHVSASGADRCLTWAEMEHVKRLFFNDDETVMQLHVPVSEHINIFPYCLHLWRPIDVEVPRPPLEMV